MHSHCWIGGNVSTGWLRYAHCLTGMCAQAKRVGLKTKSEAQIWGVVFEQKLKDHGCQCKEVHVMQFLRRPCDAACEGTMWCSMCWDHMMQCVRRTMWCSVWGNHVMQCVKESCYWAVLQTANHCAIVHVRTQIHMICTVMYKYRWRDLPSDLSQMNVRHSSCVCIHAWSIHTCAQQST